MKKREATFTFKELYEDLNRAYKQALSRHNFATQAEAVEFAINTPSSRFWVSAERLSKVINKIECGEFDKIKMNPLRREMFEELYRRYLQCKSNPENRYMTKTDMCYCVIYSVAPKFYFNTYYACNLFYRGRKEFKDER